MLLEWGWSAPDFVQMPRGIDLFCLYVLFLQYKPFDNTLNICFFKFHLIQVHYIFTYINLGKDKGSSSPGTSNGKTWQSSRGLFLGVIHGP